MTRLLKTFTIIIFLLLAIVRTYAAVETTSYSTVGQLKVGDKFSLLDDKFKLNLPYWDQIINRSVKNSVNLQLFDTELIQAPAGTVFTVVVKIDQFINNNTPPTTSTQTLTVSYNQNGGTTYNAISSYVFNNAFRVDVEVLSITSSTYPTFNDIPWVLKVSADITVDRIYPFSGSKPIAITAPDEILTGAKTFDLEWAFEIGDEEFDVEWTTIDENSPFSVTIAGMQSNAVVSAEEMDKLFRNNATRIVTQNNKYPISLAYNEKYLLVRIRRAAYNIDGVRITGDWTYKCKTSTNNLIKYNCWLLKWHEDKLNWQFSASFAEEGKRKEVISYFDGTLRNRQTVSIGNREKNKPVVSVVQENIYDEFGRPAASILPTPINKEENLQANVPYLNYQKKFNQNTSGSPYSITDIFNSVGVNCEVLPNPIFGSFGAGKYYSANNGFKTATDPKYNQYIPDAEGYPFSITQYTTDNTGRIKLQGGVGAQFQPGTGVTSNTTKYYYGKPTQRELDQLFGTDVGYAEHYTKNMVVDPNGQISLSYLNASGKTIATALSGANPTNVDELRSLTDADMGEKDEVIFKPEQFIFSNSDLKITATTSYMNAVPGQKVTLKYNLQQIVTKYPNAQVDICSNCYYDLTISIVDDCGDVISVPGFITTVGSKVEMKGIEPYKNDQFVNISFARTGEYKIKFELAYDRQAINDYTEKFVQEGISRNYLKQQFDFIKEGFLSKMNAADCYTDCRTCVIELADNVAFKAMALKEFKLLDIQDKTGQLYTDINSFIDGLYLDLKTACDNKQQTCSYSDCNAYQNVMLSHLSPGGQYATFSKAYVPPPFSQYITLYLPNEAQTNELSKHFNDVFHPSVLPAQNDADFITLVDGSRIWIYSPEFTLARMIENWRPEWALKFLQYHPEYCKLQYCQESSKYTTWEQMIRINVFGETTLSRIPGASPNITYADGAYTLLSGIDPFFSTTSTYGAQYEDDIEADLQNYTTRILKINNRPGLSLYDYVKYQLYCKDNDVGTSATWPVCNPSCRLKDREWELFSELYFQLREKYYVKGRTDYLNARGAACSCVRNIGTPITGPQSSNACPIKENFRLNVSSYDGYGTEWEVKVYNIMGSVPQKVMVKLSYTEGGTTKYINVPIAAGQGEGTVLLPFAVNYSTIAINSVVCGNVSINLQVENIQTQSLPYDYQQDWGSGTYRFYGQDTKHKIKISLRDNSGIPVAAPEGGFDVYVKTKKTLNMYSWVLYSLLNTLLSESEPIQVVHIDAGLYYALGNEYTSSLTTFYTPGNVAPYITKDQIALTCVYPIAGINSITGLTVCTDGYEEPTISCSNEAYYANKTAVFSESSTQTITVPQDGKDAVLAQNQSAFTAQINSNCADAINEWMLKLEPGLRAKYPNLNDFENVERDLRARLYAVCAKGGDVTHMMGVSELVPGILTSYQDNSFGDAIKSYTLANAKFTAGLNPWLLSYPNPYNKQKMSQTARVTKINSTIDAALKALKTSYQNSLPVSQSYSNAGFYNYLKNQYGELAMTISEVELADLVNASNCNYLLQYNILLPAFLRDGGCVTRSAYDLALNQLHSAFDISPSALMAHANYPAILTNFMNNRFGFGLTYADYKAYNTTGLLCNSIYNNEKPIDPYDCIRTTLVSALTSGVFAYEKYIQDEKNKFRAFYISQCALAQNTVNLKSTSPKYHYTLYYYDQADNLVRTVPPEGVKLLDDSQLKWIEQNRLSESSNCTDAPIICNGVPVTYSTDKTAAFTQVSTALTGGGARAFEFWFYNGAYASDYQMVQVTPDKKYMMQVGVNNGIAGFDLYPIVESADHLSASIMPTSYHYRGTFAGESSRPWLHIVVQGNNIATGGVPQIYLNGVALTVTSSITAMSPGWNITATNTGIVYPDNITTLKHMRVYSRLMTAGEISTNANDNCFKPSNGCSGMQWYRFNIPAPGGETTIAENSTVETRAIGFVPPHVLATTYAYTSTNQVLQQKSPDGGTNRFWYDELSRLVASQNDKQQPAHKYSYTNYDETLGRINEVGEKTISVADDNFMGQPGFVSKVVYRNNFLPVGTNREITRTYYDDAAPVNGGVAGIALIPEQSNLRKRVAATTYRDVQTDAVKQATYYNYDISGNVKTLWQQIDGLTQANDVNSLKRIDYEYDLISGKVNFVAYQHNTTNPKPDQFYYQYKYDSENRLTEAWSGVSAMVEPLGGSEILKHSKRLDASYAYYLHGPLARVELGDRFGKVQGLDYAYTLQGWLKGVNGSRLDPATEISFDGNTTADNIARDAFAFSLGYYNNDYKPIGGLGATAFALKYTSQSAADDGASLYNGNISNTTLAISKINNGAAAGYTYRYDQLNRLTKTFIHNGITGTTWAGTKTLLEQMTYDGNGNIETAKRYTAAGTMIDDLNYRYTKDGNNKLNTNNRLLYITDAIPAATVNDLPTQSIGNYQYDEIGNLTTDVKANISAIDWTVYGKIKGITKTAGSNLLYAYDATGNRVKKTVGSTNTYYVRDAQGNALAVYTQAGGVVTWSEQQLYGSSRLGLWQPNVNMATAGAAQTEWQKAGLKRYELTNHLGNVLATISDRRLQHPTAGNTSFDYFTADVITAQDYYPFGMQQPGRGYASNNATYRYGFNGKENDNDVGKGDGNQQDYGMRIYDPRVARFLSTDPIAKSYPELTPYQFASNRPIDGIDLDGLEWAQDINVQCSMDGLTIQTDFTVKVKVINKSTLIKDPNVIKAKALEFKAAAEAKFNTSATFFLGPIVLHEKYKTEVILDFTPPTPDDGKIGILEFDDRTSTKTTTVSGPAFTPNTISNSSVTTTTTVINSVPGVTTGQIDDFTISLGITMDGKLTNSTDFKLTGAHEFGHSGGLKHPWSLTKVEKKWAPLLDQGNTSGNSTTIKDNLMNSAENPDPAVRNSNGSDTILGQFRAISEKIKTQGNFTPADLKKSP
ncbi:RHS repeat-associated core domain-containing protein [Mucilaginibacter auburnensis]|uniref:RHS repeat-associated protein n=1 Tax=Mucilaginibacter auburnensis TaxID=1457233 RepID=A0A2H9VNU3_9SPHI|nr:RHS repeat-associated core domain-containing protein [Mucilaginibacter auburnensis]PJJ79983.1 RHS repeat-associated protein [Mucilaginibacter auburnensis]